VEKLGFRIRYGGAIAAFMSKRDWNQQIIEPSWTPPLLKWKRDFRPIHFTDRGFHRYGYTPRKGQNLPRGSKAFWRSYFGQKLRRKKHSLPLVWSGELRDVTDRGYIRATGKSGKYVMPGAQKANFRAVGSSVYMREELTRVIPAEQRAMAREMDREMVRRLRGAKTVIQKTIGGI